MTYDPQALGAQCKRCPLNDRTPVPPAPAADAAKPRLIIVGMNPGRLEESRRQPFIGPSGKMLDGCLAEASFDRAQAHVTNAAMCFSDNDDKKLKKAIACCAPRLAKELGGFDPKVPILALGAEATRVVLGKAGIFKTRGFVWTATEIKESQVKNARRNLKRGRELGMAKDKLDARRDSLALIEARAPLGGRVVIPSIHPAFILRGADGWLPVLRVDVRRAVRWARAIEATGKGFPLEDDGPFVQTHDPAVARKLLARMGPLVNVDIETDGNDPMTVGMTCVGVADVTTIEKWVKGKIKRIPKNAVVILDPWSRKLNPVLREALKDRTVLTHNGPAFDQIALERHGIHYPRCEDTLIAHYAFASDKPKALAHVASVYCDASPWKQRFKQGSEEKGVAGFGVKAEDLAKYNRADVVLGSLAWIRMQPDLERERKVYEHDMRHAALCRNMQINGILVDVERKDALSKKLKKRSAALLGEMRELLGRRSFHPARPNDIRKALFVQLKAPTYLAPPTPTGLPSTAAVVLEALRTGHNRVGKLADLIVRWRSANDSRSEYLDNLKIGGDGRLHAHWRSYGSETGRPAVRNPNLLNIPRIQYCPGCGNALLDGMTHGSIGKDGQPKPCNPKKRKDPQPEEQLRDIYVAPPGNAWVYFDLSQCEMRFAANLSGDAAFIESCKSDVHAGNARVLFAKVPGALEDLKDPKGAGKRFRDIAKNCGFAITYLAEADKLFTHLLEHGYDIDLETCQDAIDAIHTAYWRYFEYVNENIALCRRYGYLRTAFLGRKRWLGFYPKPTEVSNFPIQAGVADVMNERLGIIDGLKPKGVKHLIYQYDSSIYEVPEGKVEAMKKIVNEVWAQPVKVPATGIEFMQPIDLKVGTRWSDFG